MLVPRGERGKLLKRRKVVKLCWPSESWRRLGRRSREGRLQRHGHLPYQKWKHQTRCRRRRARAPTPPPPCRPSAIAAIRAAAVTGVAFDCIGALPPPWCTVWTVKQVHTSFTDPYQNGSIKGTAAGAIIPHCLAMMYGLENWISQDQKRKDCAFFQY
mgnify:CR=1 FL=1